MYFFFFSLESGIAKSFPVLFLQFIVHTVHIRLHAAVSCVIVRKKLLVIFVIAQKVLRPL